MLSIEGVGVGAWRDAVGRGLSGILSLAVLLGGITGVVVARAGVLDAAGQPSAAGASGLSPSQLTDGAAAKLEAATAAGGKGYSFRITQTSTITAKADGPRIEIPDPVDPHKSLGFADDYLFYSLIERGIMTADGFWSELRVGPPAGAAPRRRAPRQGPRPGPAPPSSGAGEGRAASC